LDEKQLFKNLLKQPYSKQALKDICDAFNDLSGRDRRELISEELASPDSLLNKFSNLTRQFAQIQEKLIAQIEPLARIDQDRVIRHFAPLLTAELAREKGAEVVAKQQKIFDDAVAAEAISKNKTLAVSTKFVEIVSPGLKKQGFKAGREKVLNSVRRLKSIRNRRNSTCS
jgi:hypothetical protein